MFRQIAQRDDDRRITRARYPVALARWQVFADARQAHERHAVAQYLAATAPDLVRAQAEDRVAAVDTDRDLDGDRPFDQHPLVCLGCRLPRDRGIERRQAWAADDETGARVFPPAHTHTACATTYGYATPALFNIGEPLRACLVCYQTFCLPLDAPLRARPRPSARPTASSSLGSGTRICSTAAFSLRTPPTRTPPSGARIASAGPRPPLSLL